MVEGLSRGFGAGFLGTLLPGESISFIRFRL